MPRTFALSFSLLPIFACQLSIGGNALRNEGFALGPYKPGKLNSIADVGNVRVGHATLSKGAIRTGVTVVLPEGDAWTNGLPAAVSTFNGVGEATGFANVSEMGLLQTPIALTNTLSVSDVQKALAKWVLKKHKDVESLMPVVMECDDSSLNDIQGYHVKEEQVLNALKDATSKFEEGSVGAGTGMISFDFKSGIGSSSRMVDAGSKTHALGVLVNSNIGTATRSVFRLFGLEVGKLVTDLKPIEKPWASRGAGSVVIVVATDAPLDSRQLGRLAKRASSGVFRLGTPGYNGSGDFTLAFSTVNRIGMSRTNALKESDLNSFFEAVADATEEAVLNSMLASTDMTGRDGNRVYALPFAKLKPMIKGYR